MGRQRSNNAPAGSPVSENGLESSLTGLMRGMGPDMQSSRHLQHLQSPVQIHSANIKGTYKYILTHANKSADLLFLQTLSFSLCLSLSLTHTRTHTHTVVVGSGRRLARTQRVGSEHRASTHKVLSLSILCDTIVFNFLRKIFKLNL